jgi:hypothetical protein
LTFDIFLKGFFWGVWCYRRHAQIRENAGEDAGEGAHVIPGPGLVHFVQLFPFDFIFLHKNVPLNTYKYAKYAV